MRCLRALDEVFSPKELAAIRAACIGPTYSSYTYRRAQWALPLDAATQVAVSRPELPSASVPATWQEVVSLSEKTGKVALSLAGPHALLSFFSICSAFGFLPGEDDPSVFVSDEVGTAAIGLMQRLSERSPLSVRGKNPIGILGHMQDQDDILYCPLIYGYVNYASPANATPLVFHNAPAQRHGGRPGATLGGTGIAISRRCPVTPELKAHLLWLMSRDAQVGFIPRYDGQPSFRAAWQDGAVNREWGGFYRNTEASLEQSYVRPRYAGYIPFQSKASECLREQLAAGNEPATVLDRLRALYEASRLGQREEVLS